MPNHAHRATLSQGLGLGVQARQGSSGLVRALRGSSGPVRALQGPLGLFGALRFGAVRGPSGLFGALRGLSGPVSLLGLFGCLWGSLRPSWVPFFGLFVLLRAFRSFRRPSGSFSIFLGPFRAHRRLWGCPSGISRRCFWFLCVFL